MSATVQTLVTSTSYRVAVEVRRHDVRQDGSVDPRGTLVRQAVLHDAALKIEEAITVEGRSMSVTVVGRVPAGSDSNSREHILRDIAGIPS